jgi:hypothetical protein
MPVRINVLSLGLNNKWAYTIIFKGNLQYRDISEKNLHYNISTIMPLYMPCVPPISSALTYHFHSIRLIQKVSTVSL